MSVTTASADVSCRGRQLEKGSPADVDCAAQKSKKRRRSVRGRRSSVGVVLRELHSEGSPLTEQVFIEGDMEGKNELYEKKLSEMTTEIAELEAYNKRLEAENDAWERLLKKKEANREAAVKAENTPLEVDSTTVKRVRHKLQSLLPGPSACDIAQRILSRNKNVAAEEEKASSLEAEVKRLEEVLKRSMQKVALQRECLFLKVEENYQEEIDMLERLFKEDEEWIRGNGYGNECDYVIEKLELEFCGDHFIAM